MICQAIAAIGNYVDVLPKVNAFVGKTTCHGLSGMRPVQGLRALMLRVQTRDPTGPGWKIHDPTVTGCRTRRPRRMKCIKDLPLQVWCLFLMTTDKTKGKPILVVHSSDLHVDDGYTARAWGGDGTAPLAAVLETSRAVNADLVLLSGDVFDHNRLPQPVLQKAAEILEDASVPVVMLPGNHDPLMPASVWHRGGFGQCGTVHILGLDSDSVTFHDFDLRIWGRAHMDYGDMAPLASPGQRSTRWHIVTGHGHFVSEKPEGLAPSWLISEAEITATAADYVALGHWNRHVCVANDSVPAYYSGSPDLARTVNLVRLYPSGQVQVDRESLRSPVTG